VLGPLNSLTPIPEMILCDTEITDLCINAQLVTPFDPQLVNPASIDVRLGGTILIESAQHRTLIPYPLEDHTEDNPYHLVPGQFCLAQTVETFNLPDNIAAQFMLKSSRAREGLEHLMAGYCDPGWHGSVLTLELHNSRQLWPQLLWPGMKIGQMVFHRMSDIPARSYAVTGRYNADTTVQASRG
jgi:dCTP deaminase